jgi:glycosyltransferase involved in cell wall biosynthesis
MKVLIVEEALKSLHGHWFQYVGDIYDGGQEAGHQIEVAVHRDACPEILERFHCHPILGESVFGKDASGGGLKGLLRMARRNISLLQELRNHFKRGHRYDAVIATTPRIDHLYSYLALNQLWGGKAFMQIVLIFVESVGSYSEDFSTLHFGKKSLPLKWGMQLTKCLPNAKRIKLATESKGLARHFRGFCGLDFHLVPHVTQWVEPKNPPQRNNGKLVLGTFGFTRYDKGADVLQAALRILVSEGMPEGCHFVIQWTGDYRLPEGELITIDPELEKRPDVEYLGAFTSALNFPHWLARTDIMILPYRRAFYYDKLSRVAIDAAEAGMPMVYPRGTWLESFVAEYGAGVPFEPDNAQSLAEALKKVIRDFLNLRVQAQARAVATREEFSARRFFEIVENMPKKLKASA